MTSYACFLIAAVICFTIYKCLVLYYDNRCKHAWNALQTINVFETGHKNPYETIYVSCCKKCLKIKKQTVSS